MIRATRVIDHVHDPATKITLDETARHRRRMVMTTDRMANGSTLQFLLDLPKAQLLRHGNGLVLEDGTIVEVLAAAEPLLEIKAANQAHLLAIAWQIGNRHLAAQINEASIIIRRDHVIKAMLEGLGATVTDIIAPFDPEGGAYGGQHQPHSHGDGHDHEH